MKSSIYETGNITSFYSINVSAPNQTDIPGMSNVYSANVDFNKGTVNMPQLEYYHICLELFESGKRYILQVIRMLYMYMEKRRWFI